MQNFLRVDLHPPQIIDVYLYIKNKIGLKLSIFRSQNANFSLEAWTPILRN